ncbi:MAG TPA: matrixin family metalloprotease [Byssovorax sp.]|jgi:predicted Zn-dependent protease
MRAEPLVAAAATVLALAMGTANASAYCRTSVCDGDTSQVCVPEPGGVDCGTPLFWASRCVSWSMQADASDQISLADATPIFAAAFANWASAPCAGGGTPSLVVTQLADVTCHQIEYNQDGGNANVIMFDDTTWPYAGTSATLALTTVTYDLDTGEIYDADMELNSSAVTFTTSTTGTVDFDLPSIAQHETGHFLGLAHSQDTSATMYATYNEGDTSLRTIEPDDIDAICAAYPPGATPDATCDTTPRHGFSAICGGTDVSDSSSGCAASPGPISGAGALAAAWAALAVVARRRRARAGGARAAR